MQITVGTTFKGKLRSMDIATHRHHTLQAMGKKNSVISNGECNSA